MGITKIQAWQLSSSITSGEGSGTSGFSGFSGTNGSTGTSGFSGFSGSGLSGFSGFSGVTGTNGTSGFSGFSGASGGGSSPSWYGNIYGAYGNCDPQILLEMATTNGTTGATPTNIGSTVARIAYFRSPSSLTVNRIRWRGIAKVSSIYKVAVYDAETLVRISSDLTVSTAVAAWGSVSDTFSLSTNHLYFIAVSANTTGTTAGFMSISPTVAAGTGLIGSLPTSYPGNLNISNGYISGTFAQFTVAAGVMPSTAPSIEAQAAWTGGFPAFWLDNNSAA